MSSVKHLTGALIAALAFFSAANAEAKGPQGVGAGSSGAIPSHSAAPNSQGVGSNTWTQPPGWGNATDSKGWDGASSPPGWDNNSAGQASGWSSAPASGLGKR